MGIGVVLILAVALVQPIGVSTLQRKIRPAGIGSLSNEIHKAIDQYLADPEQVEVCSECVPLTWPLILCFPRNVRRFSLSHHYWHCTRDSSIADDEQTIALRPVCVKQHQQCGKYNDDQRHLNQKTGDNGNRERLLHGRSLANGQG